jgi:hypothetical protein
VRLKPTHEPRLPSERSRPCASIATGSCPIALVEVGAPPHFSTFFRKVTGATPTRRRAPHRSTSMGAPRLAT